VLVLGIESSCDETAAAVVSGDGRVVCDVVASQLAVHAPYGGVVPELASRAHLTNVVPVIEQALEQVEGGLGAIDAIAVTQGPGLAGALLVGLSTAKAIAFARDLPIVGVDHLVGHLFAVYLDRGDRDRGGAPPKRPALPYVALLVSGGHTAIYEVTGPGEAHILGQTRDDAAGEAFDKVAKLLGLGYPGGPVIDRLAAKGDPKAIALPVPMASRRTLDFSFSGLKTAVVRHVKDRGVPADESAMADLCASFQRAAVRVLAQKSVHACTSREIPRLVLGGGVAANSGLRASAAALCRKNGVELFVPPLASCTDNAAMIAYAGVMRLARGERDDLELAPYSRSPDLRRGKMPKRR
jgi:N6-L-threonylcarbamoyladenine synthase